MAGNGTLDDDGLLDLAEVRWRTGDLPGAGEASAAFLTSGRESVLALVITAEATAALGRPGEARRLAGRALEAADGPLEPLFAGLPRSPIWPQDPADRAEPAGRFFADVGGSSASRATPGALDTASTGPAAAGDAGMAAERAGVGFGGEALPASLWDAHLHGAHPHAALPPPALPDGAMALDAARRALRAGDAQDAVVQLGLVLRVSPGLAPAVLDVAGSMTGAGFDLIRGDAYRLVGHEAEAQRAYASAASTLSGSAAPGHAAPPMEPAGPSGPATPPMEPAGPSGPATPPMEPAPPPTEAVAHEPTVAEEPDIATPPGAGGYVKPEAS
jgi:hypothetical protein